MYSVMDFKTLTSLYLQFLLNFLFVRDENLTICLSSCTFVHAWLERGGGNQLGQNLLFKFNEFVIVF